MHSHLCLATHNCLRHSFVDEKVLVLGEEEGGREGGRRWEGGREGGRGRVGGREGEGRREGGGG